MLSSALKRGTPLSTPKISPINHQISKPVQVRRQVTIIQKQEVAYRLPLVPLVILTGVMSVILRCLGEFGSFVAYHVKMVKVNLILSAIECGSKI